MFLVSIDTEACTGCGQCASSCPAQIITIVDQMPQAGGEPLAKKAQVSGDGNECLGCESCVVVCEVGGVTVQEY